MKRIIVLFLVIVMCFAICSCSNNSTGNGGEATKITISHCQGEWSWPILDKLAEEFKAETGIEVEFIYVAADAYNQWREAQLVAGSEPDIIWGMTNVKEYYNNGKIMDLTDYYNKENPFSGNIWKDDYMDGILDKCYDESGERMIANAIAVTRMDLYYNKTIFNELGLEVPENWSEVLECSKVIKEAGYIPISIMNASSFNIEWFTDAILEDCYATSGKAEKLDIITKNGKLDDAEKLLGIKTGVIKYTDEEFVAFLKLMKELQQYFNTGYNSASFEYEALFNEGKSAMTINGSWYPNQHQVGNFKVDYGVAPVPYVDDAIYANARNRQAKFAMGAAAPEIVITKKAENEGRGEAAVKFLQYISNANGAGETWVNETMFLPVIKGVDLPDIMKPFDTFYGTDKKVYYPMGFLNFDGEAYTAYHKMISDYLENDTSAEDFAAETQKLYDGYIDEAIEMSQTDIKSYIDKVKY